MNKGIGSRVSGRIKKPKRSSRGRVCRGRGDLRNPSFSYPEAGIRKSKSQTKIATPVNTLYLDLPLPSRERTEVRGTDPRTFFTLTPTLSPQGRGRLRKGFARGSARNDFLFISLIPTPEAGSPHLFFTQALPNSPFYRACLVIARNEVTKQSKISQSWIATPRPLRDRSDL